MASTSNAKQGRKWRVLTSEKKLDIIKELKNGKSQQCVSELYQKIDEKDVSKQVLATMMAIAGTLTVKAVCRGATVDKCTVIVLLVNCRTVKASTGWLKRFLLRHGMRSITLQGEALSADVSSVGNFRKELAEFIEEGGYTLSQVFNADETGLWWKLMPSKTFVHHVEVQAKTFKKHKDWVTLMGCANAAGTCKLPLAFIHKSARPRCFKNTSMNALPVCYFSQKKAWMDTTIFKKWFHDVFVPYVRKFCRDNDITSSGQCSCPSLNVHIAIK